MYAVVLALLSFAPWFRGARLRIWVDNTCAEKMLFRGSGRAPDHNRAHFVWTWALEQWCSLWLERVPSEDNLADEPSRQKFRTLQALGAELVMPVLHRV